MNVIETINVDENLDTLSPFMLISPALCHDRLSAIIAQDSGPHTALLATPNGQLVSRVTKDRTVTGSSDDDEPWLDEPERIRLLLGLLSQWEDAESPRIECEVGSHGCLGVHVSSDAFSYDHCT